MSLARSGADGVTAPRSATRPNDAAAAPIPAPEGPDGPKKQRPLWVRWVALILFVAFLGTVFVNLGEWQLSRLHQRKARNATTITNEGAPIKGADQVFTHPIVDADEWQRAEARGTFDAAHQFVVRYRNNGDDDGYEIVTPLTMATGTLLVDRGFVKTTGSAQIPAAAPPPPAGQVTVIGHVRRSEHGSHAATTPVNGQMRLIDSGAIAATLPYPVADGYLSAISVDPPQDGSLVPIVLPELSNGPHFWYAVQWFMFTGIAIAGIVVFIRGDLRDRRAAAAGEPLPEPGRRRARKRPTATH